GLYAAGVDQAGHLHAGVVRQVRDEGAVVGHVAVHHAGGAGDDRVHDARAVLDARGELGLEPLELGVDVALVVVGYADLVVVPALGDELPRQVRVLAEVGQVLGGVVAGLGLEVAEGVHDRGAHLFVAALVDVRALSDLRAVPVVAREVRGPAATLMLLGHHLTHPRVQVLLAAGELEDPGLVVDAGAAVGDLLVGDTEGAGEHAGGALHAVAQAHGAQALRVQVCGGHRHGVGVVDEGG